ncbi:MAG: hypothetical protein ACKO1F_15020 [Flammeovirgaceae bacterium]
MLKTKRKSSRKITSQKNKKRVVSLRQKKEKAIEKTIEFWKLHAIDLTGFVFNREEANAR